MPQELRDNQCKEVPLGRFSKPHEQAGQVVYLLSPLSSYQTGSSVYIDGSFFLPLPALLPSYTALGRRADYICSPTRAGGYLTWFVSAFFLSFLSC
jgi:hypothetical protein